MSDIDFKKATEIAKKGVQDLVGNVSNIILEGLFDRGDNYIVTLSYTV